MSGPAVGGDKESDTMPPDRRPTDHELLVRFSRHTDHEAFAELVNRHLGFVRASAARQVGADLAADVAQAVFLVLARKAPTLGPDAILPSWLFRTTRFIAARVRRTESRRRQRESAAILMTPPPDPGPVAPPDGRDGPPLDSHLDDALADLSENDRRFVLIRYFERREFEEVGSRFGVSAEAARKRVARALERMRTFLARRGVTLTAATLGVLFPEPSAEAAPQALLGALRRRLDVARPAPGAADPLRGWVEGALRDWAWIGLLRGVFRGLPAVLLVTAGVVGWNLARPADRPSPTVGDRAVATIDGIGAGSVVRGASPDALARPTAVLELRVVDETTDAAVPDAEITTEIWDDRRVLRGESRRTDRAGACPIAVREPAFRLLRVWVSAAGHVPVVMDWHAHELADPGLSHICRLAPGRTLAGEVRDESGQPIANAALRFREPGLDLTRRENIGFPPRTFRIASDEQGRFRSDQMPGDWTTSPLTVFVRHPDYAPLEYSVTTAAAWSTNHLVVLSRGIPVRGQVLDPDGAPVVAATVRHASGDAWPEDQTNTDLDGRFEFPQVAPGPFPFTVSAAGYDRYQGFVEASTGIKPIAVLLSASAPPAESPAPVDSRSLHLSATVREADTGAPVPRFRVIVADNGGSDRHLLGEGRDGALEWDIDARFFGEFHLEIEADGYQPQASERRTVRSDTERFEFRMVPGGVVHGIVLLPDGRPAAGARVALAGKERGLTMLEPGRLEGGAGSHARLTGPDGAFRLPLAVGDERVRIVHSEGSAFLPVEACDGSPIRLDPWGVVHGKLRKGDRPLAGLPITLGRRSPGPGRDAAAFDFGYTARTDAEGSFRFECVPPGTHRLRSLALPRLQEPTVEVAPGATVEIDLVRD